MNLVVRNVSTNRATHYTLRELSNEARSAAQGRGKLVRWWVEVFSEGSNLDTCCLRVEIKRADGLGEIVNVAI